MPEPLSLILSTRFGGTHSRCSIGRVSQLPIFVQRTSLNGCSIRFKLPLFVEKGILRLLVGKGRHAPVGAEDQGRVIAAILQNPGEHKGQTYPLFGPVEMDHEQMASELSEALSRKIVFQNVSIDEEILSKVVYGR